VTGQVRQRSLWSWSVAQTFASQKVCDFFVWLQALRHRYTPQVSEASDE
jgi:hypothetical protein